MINTKFVLKDEIFNEYSTYTNCFFIKSSEKIHKISLNFSRIIGFHKLASIKKFLHDDEFRYFETLKYNQRINSFLLGRYSAKKAVSLLVNENILKKIAIKNGIFNQPVVVCEACSNIQISVTHCNDLASAVAFDNMLILGIDIEKVNQRINSGVEAALTQYEKELTDRVPYSYESFLLMIWTIKESLSKALKTGLMIPLSILEIKQIEAHNGYFISTFTNFLQYKSISFFVQEYVYSITYPKNAEIDIDINMIKNNLYNMIYK